METVEEVLVDEVVVVVVVEEEEGVVVVVEEVEEEEGVEVERTFHESIWRHLAAIMASWPAERFSELELITAERSMIWFWVPSCVVMGLCVTFLKRKKGFLNQ